MKKKAAMKVSDAVAPIASPAVREISTIAQAAAFDEVIRLIEASRIQAAQAVNTVQPILSTLLRELPWSSNLHIISSQENAAFECSSAPTGRQHNSPGQRPGFDITHVIQALKGRPKARRESHSKRSIWHVPSGLNSIKTVDLGRCPRLLWNCPVGALQGAAS